MLVVPDGRLWRVAYSDAGTIAEAPTTVPQTTLFYDNSWEYEGRVYSVSHVEIVTLAALGERTKYLAGRKGPFEMDWAIFEL